MTPDPVRRSCPWLQAARDLDAVWGDAPPADLWWAVIRNGSRSCALQDRTDAGWTAESFRDRGATAEVVVDLGDWRNIGILIGTLADHSGFVEVVQRSDPGGVDVLAMSRMDYGAEGSSDEVGGHDAWGEAVARAVIAAICADH